MTAFEPFGGETVNPSQTAVAVLRGLALPGIELRTLSLPTCFGHSLALIERTLDEWPADVVLAVGLAGGRSGLSVERVAINLDDARIPDNAGQQPIDQPVVAGAPAAYFSALPVKAMVAAIRDAGIDAAVSHSAGTFVCNHVFFGLSHMAATRRPGLRCGFIHIPWAPEQAEHHGGPSLDAAGVARGLAAALMAIKLGAPEPTVSEGALS